MRRRILSIILAVTMCLAFMPTFAFADVENENSEQEPEFEIESVEGEETPEVIPEPAKTKSEDIKAKTGDNQVKSEGPQTKDETGQTESNIKDSSVDTKSERLGDSYEDDDYDPYYIENYTFKLSQTKYFNNGKPRKPKVTCDGLTEGEDYFVEYEIDDYDEIYAGTYYVYIYGELDYYGEGDYYGEVELSYKIVSTSISLDKTSATLYRKGTTQLKATVKNPNGSTTYKSSNTKVATVTSKGKITAKSKGTAKITVKNGYAKKTVKVTVKNPKLSASKATLRINNTKKLKITGKVGKASFKSSNKKIASVNKYGKITAKKKGKCTITVKTNGITLKCKVTVKNPKLSNSKVVLHNSYTKKLKVIGGKGKIKWKTSNSKVATVSSSGKVKAKKAGSCTITAKRGKYTMKCKIVVPSTYKGYSRIPDFGAIYGKTAITKSVEGSSYMLIYKAKKSYESKYIKRLKKKGFEYYTTEESIKIYLNDYLDVVGLYYKDGKLFVTYSNLWDLEE